MIKFTPIKTTGPDNRGYTAEFYQGRLGQHLIVFRKAGTVSGRHYHKGISLTKKPEIFILMHGTCVVNWREINNTTMHSKVIEGPMIIETDPYVWHEYITETDCTFLELNSLSEHAADTFYTD
ncbi:polysaccharide biosynthesis C-terminal domain-containing protein [Chitinophagaceae bacterium MMS25-I14]